MKTIVPGYSLEQGTGPKTIKKGQTVMTDAEKRKRKAAYDKKRRAEKAAKAKAARDESKPKPKAGKPAPAPKPVPKIRDQVTRYPGTKKVDFRDNPKVPGGVVYTCPSHRVYTRPDGSGLHGTAIAKWRTENSGKVWETFKIGEFIPQDRRAGSIRDGIVALEDARAAMMLKLEGSALEAGGKLLRPIDVRTDLTGKEPKFTIWAEDLATGELQDVPLSGAKVLTGAALAKAAERAKKEALKAADELVQGIEVIGADDLGAALKLTKEVKRLLGA